MEIWRSDPSRARAGERVGGRYPTDRDSYIHCDVTGDQFRVWTPGRAEGKPATVTWACPAGLGRAVAPSAHARLNPGTPARKSAASELSGGSESAATVPGYRITAADAAHPGRALACDQERNLDGRNNGMRWPSSGALHDHYAAVNGAVWLERYPVIHMGGIGAT